MRNPEIKNDFHRFLILSICAVVFLIPIVEDAYAVRPNVQTFVASDAAYSDGDTLTITFDIATNQTGVMTQPNVNGNFTFSQGLGATYSGVWTGSSTLVITVTSTFGHGGVAVGTTTVTPTAGNTIGDAVSTPGDNAIGIATLSLGAGGGGGCSGDCNPPTLGITNDGRRLVDNGFSYNGYPANVDYFFTPYPLITTQVGKPNIATFKIYEDSGVEQIRHFSLAFGLARGQILEQSQAVIEWDRTWDGKESIKIIDPQNALGKVFVTSSTGACRENNILAQDCLILMVLHTFRAPLDFNIVATNVWDEKRNSWQNYYNDGVQVEGDSLNPPAEFTGILNGNLVTLTETGKNSAVDNEGNTWTLDKTWTRDFISNGKIVDGASSKWIDRNNAWFDSYKKGQELLAEQILEEILGGELRYFDSLDEPTTIHNDILKRSEDFDLQQRINFENYKAYQIFKQLYSDVQQKH